MKVAGRPADWPNSSPFSLLALPDELTVEGRLEKTAERARRIVIYTELRERGEPLCVAGDDDLGRRDDE